MWQMYINLKILALFFKKIKGIILVLNIYFFERLWNCHFFSHKFVLYYENDKKYKLVVDSF